jgi:hypothetical protein
LEPLNIAQNLLFERHADSISAERMPIVFLLGSPRTGSTLVYQLVVNFFDFYYFSNFVADYFAETPVVGAALEESLNPREQVSYESAYGKTSGLWEPSEASAIFKNWFGGGHPSQTVSAAVLPEKEAHLVLTTQSIYGLTRKPILVKNAWNCFRIPDLARIFPNAHFVWIRRDIARSALSDLAARYRRGGPEVWNSATPANYLEIQKLPYWKQVVEQQYEYNKTIEEDLHTSASGNFYEIWYEDICTDLKTQLYALADFLEGMGAGISLANLPLPPLNDSPLGAANQFPKDWRKIWEYVEENVDKFSSFTHI